ncbi:uncharacterized protein LOC115739971 isoform X1 [Rhodamnia argentea]|uniref:Uncharacterized protein LOC115739971 isoform X1 n=1 Tax=Rhodamnia argentea TaxID=178133 RepID=A0A8B8P2T4_9MYRT|nr:uncharacterized protein LOC115739971 isoform X1 [Rhodamnia argentea]
MAMESNMPSSSALSRHAISFQTGAVNTTSDVAPMMGSNYFGVNSSGGMVFSAGNSATMSNNLGLPQSGNSSSSLLLDYVPGLKHDADLAVEWSAEEQDKLYEGLRRFADEPNIMKYIRIAATLQDKTVRDVALRCRWMTRKRRKPEEHNLGKKVNSRKDKLVELPPTNASCLPQNMAAYSPMVQHVDPNELLYCEGIDGTSRQLLKQNAQAFNQISANMHMLKLQENLDLFCHVRNNITSILKNMRDTPGIMSQMPPLPVSIDEDLANTILPNISQPIMFGSHGRIQLKQEPRC